MTARVTFVVGAIAITLGFAGCATTVAPVDTTPDATAAADATSSPISEVTDLESCEAFTDVSTIAQNALTGRQDQRMTQQEYDGWMRLATRVLDRIPTRGEGAVSDAIEALKEAAPAVPAGAYGGASSGVLGSDAAAPLVEACAAAGYEMFTEAFTGG